MVVPVSVSIRFNATKVIRQEVCDEDLVIFCFYVIFV